MEPKYLRHLEIAPLKSLNFKDFSNMVFMFSEQMNWYCKVFFARSQLKHLVAHGTWLGVYFSSNCHYFSSVPVWCGCLPC